MSRASPWRGRVSVRACFAASIEAFLAHHTGAEKIHRLIFGSQITLLRSLNTMPPKWSRSMKGRKASFPSSTLAYESWKDFLLGTQSSSTRATCIRSLMGRDFLTWMATGDLPKQRPDSRDALTARDDRGESFRSPT